MIMTHQSDKADFITGDVHWKRYLILIWLTQCLFQLSFSFAFPFVPFFMQSIGVTEKALPFWVALFGAGPALTTMLSSPFWGMMANRYGCKKMLLRCYFGGAAILVGIALCSKPHWMIILRLLQGCVCGSVPVALTLVSSLVPKEHFGMAMGVVNSSTFSGLLFGAFFGGIAADLFGYRISFLLSGVPCLIAAVIMIFCIKEHFTSPKEKKTAGSLLSSQWKKMRLSHWQRIQVMPVLCILGIVMFGRLFDSSFLALFVQQIHGSIQGASTWTGIISALCGVAGALSGLTAGWLSDRFDPGKTAMALAGLAGILLFSVSLTPGMLYLAIVRPLASFAVDSIEPSLQVWLCNKVSQTARNLVFAWAQSIRSLGWFLAPLAGGMVVDLFGLRALFIASAGIFFVVMMLVIYTYGKERKHFAEKHRKAVVVDEATIQ